nr:hypothetical protein [Treponema sp.]
SRTLLLILIIGAALFAIQGCTPSAASASAGQPTDPTNPEQTIKVQDTGIYKALTSLGFDISTEKVEAIDGQYQPKTGDITSLSYRAVDTKNKVGYSYSLDREKSTENNLIYKGKLVDERNNETYDTENNTITVNKEEKSINIYDSIFDDHYKFTLNDDGTISIGGKRKVTVGANGSLYDNSGYEVLADIKIKLAE